MSHAYRQLQIHGIQGIVRTSSYEWCLSVLGFHEDDNQVLCPDTMPGMNVDWIRSYCLSFPQASEKLQWGDDLCFKIGGRIFGIVGLDNPRLCFKCTPDTFAELIERQDIRPAPYVGRYKWVMLDRLDAVGADELKDLIRQSYEMVAAKAPKEKSRTKKRSKSPIWKKKRV